MIIDLQKTAISLRLKSMAITIVFTLAIIVSLFGNKLFEVKKLFGLELATYSYMIIGLFLLYVLYNAILNRHYIYYSDEEKNLVFRFYSLSILGSKKRSVEIPKNTLLKFELSKSFLGLKTELILYQKLKEGAAKYPPINITALSKGEKNKLALSLEKFSRKKTRS